MKKIISLILCLVVLTCCVSFAETDEKELLSTVSVNGTFNIKCRLPDGYKITFLDSDSTGLIATISSEDPEKPLLTLSIIFNDLYTQDGVAMRLNDVSDEELALIKESFSEDATKVEFLDGETAYGTKVIIIKGVVGDWNYVDVYSIYKSYEIEATVTTGLEAADRTLTDEQIQMAIDFLSDMDFEDVAD